MSTNIQLSKYSLFTQQKSLNTPELGGYLSKNKGLTPMRYMCKDMTPGKGTGTISERVSFERKVRYLALISRRLKYIVWVGFGWPPKRLPISVS